MSLTNMRRGYERILYPRVFKEMLKSFPLGWIDLNEENKVEDDAYCHHYHLTRPQKFQQRVKQEQIGGMDIVNEEMQLFFSFLMI